MYQSFQCDQRDGFAEVALGEGRVQLDTFVGVSKGFFVLGQ